MTAMWRYLVHDSFFLTGRGAAVVGQLVGHVRPGDPAELNDQRRVMPLPAVWPEFVRQEGGEGIGLLLCGLTRDQLPAPGSTVVG